MEPPATHFYTRQILLPILLTVHPSLQPLNMDILNYSADGGNLGLTEVDGLPRWLGEEGRNISVEEMTVDAEAALRSFGGDGGSDNQQRMEGERGRKDEYCLFTFDLRNMWRGPFEVFFDVFDGRFWFSLCLTRFVYVASLSLFR